FNSYDQFQDVKSFLLKEGSRSLQFKKSEGYTNRTYTWKGTDYCCRNSYVRIWSSCMLELYDPCDKVIRTLAEEVFFIVGRDPLIEIPRCKKLQFEQPTEARLLRIAYMGFAVYRKEYQ
ncbi:hypothetical protein C5167_051197, partial [Papaver somniferum]